VERDLRSYFDHRVSDAETRVAQRMLAYEQVLCAAAGLFAASGDVQRAEFREYVASLRVEEHYPGIQGIGFSQLVPPAALESHTASIRAEGFPGYEVHPAGRRDAYTAIIYLEPFTGRNLRAFGYDMFSEAVRRAAMERARKSGAAALTGKVKLIQETDKDVQAGAIMYVPVYRRAAGEGSAAERRGDLVGWVYAPFRMADLMVGIFGKDFDLDVEIFDGAVPSGASLIFDSDGSPVEPGDEPAQGRALRTLEVAGQRWTMLVRMPPAFAAQAASDRPSWVVVAGVTASGLVAALVWLLAYGGARAAREARALNREIADRNQAELALRQSEERFRALIEKARDMTVVLEADERVVFWSPSAVEALGWTQDEVLGRTAAEIIHPEDAPAASAAFTAMLGVPGATSSVTVRIRHKDGSWRLVDCLRRNLLGDSAVRGVVMNARDVTEQRRLEDQLRQAQSLESIGRLAGGIAHDFNNLLTVILAGTEQLNLEAAEGARPDPEIVHEIDAAAQRARDLTRQMLAFARKQVIAPVVLDLSDLVVNAEKLLRRVLGEDIEFTVRLAPGRCTVRCDPSQLEQIVVNLAVNARDAMPRGGRLTVETANVQLGSGQVPTRGEAPPGAYVSLVVRDTGCGMSAEVKARIFEPFFTTKPAGRGTGLGLSTVYGIVKQSNGYIHVETEPGGGTTFEILLPRVLAMPVAARECAAPRAGGGTETVLVVEDDAPVRAVTVRALRAAGYDVMTAANGREALTIGDAELSRIRLLVTDVVMPGVDGRTLADALLVRRPDLAVLFVSGYTHDTIADRGVLASGIEFLPKPFTAPSLLARVRTMLDAHGCARAAVG
jgi:PAS domain S-box-containing protein